MAERPSSSTRTVLGKMILPKFESPEAEAAFWMLHDAQTYKMRIVALWACFLSFTAFGLLDIYAAATAAPTMLAMRGVASLILLFAVLRFVNPSGTPGSRENDIMLGASGCVTVQVGLILFAPAETSVYYQFGLGVILAVGALIIVPRFRTVLMMSTYTTILYFLTLPWHPGDMVAAVVNTTFNLMIAGAVLTGSFMRERGAREQAMTEADLASLNDDLKASRLEAMEARDVAIAANRAKSHFFANVSHELRTPMNAILGFSDIMRNEMFGPVGEPRYTEYVQHIHSSGLLLKTNIEDILDLARLEAGKFGWQEEPFTLEEAVETVLATCTHDAENAGVTFTVEHPLPDVAVMADVTRVAQALINLVTNALKFTDSDGVVRLQAILMDNGTCVLRVCDTGCGMSPESLERVRMPFAQAHEDSYSKGKGGLGLGLAIVSGIVEKMEGRFDLESEEGVGTTATLVIPAHRISAVARDAA